MEEKITFKAEIEFKGGIEEFQRVAEVLADRRVSPEEIKRLGLDLCPELEGEERDYAVRQILRDILA